MPLPLQTCLSSIGIAFLSTRHSVALRSHRRLALTLHRRSAARHSMVRTRSRPRRTAYCARSLDGCSVALVACCLPLASFVSSLGRSTTSYMTWGLGLCRLLLILVDTTMRAGNHWGTLTLCRPTSPLPSSSLSSSSFSRSSMHGRTFRLHASWRLSKVCCPPTLLSCATGCRRLFLLPHSSRATSSILSWVRRYPRTSS
jgi:hypothetical protein